MISEPESEPEHKPNTLTIYDLTITYTDEKASLLKPGSISNQDVYAVVKEDFRAFRIFKEPPAESIQLRSRGVISFPLTSSETDAKVLTALYFENYFSDRIYIYQYYSVFKYLEENQNRDPKMFEIKKQRSMWVLAFWLSLFWLMVTNLAD